MRVLIVTGSSGGHIFPALALAERLKKLDQDVLLVLPEDGRKKTVFTDSTPTEYIWAAKLDFSLNKTNLVGFYFFLKGAGQALRIILRFKPLVVVGFGSLNSISLIYWAWLFRIKTIIHEQNVVAGRANRLLAKFVDRVAVSFSQTYKYLDLPDGKVVLTGNPLRDSLVRREKKEALDFFKLKEGKFTILITGGSQGAHKLNAVCLEALSIYQMKPDLQIIHISGMPDYAWLKDGYARTTLFYKLFDFLPEMQYAYSAADLVICRAGATTIAELGRFRVPAILVPYPFAYAHQLANAQVLTSIGAAEILFDADLSAPKLKQRLHEYFCNQEKLKVMQKAYQELPVWDSTTMLADEVLSLR